MLTVDFLDLLATLANHPLVRVATLAISALSLWFAIKAFNKTKEAVANYWKNMSAEHSRYLDSRWNDTFKLALTSPEFAKQSATIFGLTDEEAKYEAAVMMYLNICSIAFESHRHQVIDREARDEHMRSFFGHYKGDIDALERIIGLEGYAPDFQEECKAYVKHLRDGNLATSVRPVPVAV